MEINKVLCLVLMLVMAFFSWLSDTSSIYVGRHASASRPQLAKNYEDCRDFDAKMCQKIIFWFGHKACKDQQNTRHYTKDLSRICPKSCGLCDCKDTGRFCKMLSSLCSSSDETGKFLKQRCPKTCNTCRGTVEGEPELAGFM